VFTSVEKRSPARSDSVNKRHLDQLQQTWSDESITNIELEHQLLRSAYLHERPFKEALDACDNKTSFQEGWHIVGERFRDLRNFCGGIATVFPNTATVESGFSQLGWEKDEYRMSLTDLSLEGILQCKQFKTLKFLAS
jgi:hypothetical protein